MGFTIYQDYLYSLVHAPEQPIVLRTQLVSYNSPSSPDCKPKILLLLFYLPFFSLCLDIMIVQHWFGQDDKRILQIFVTTRLWQWMQLFHNLFFLVLIFFIPGRWLAIERRTRTIGISALLRFRTKLGADRAEVA